MKLLVDTNVLLPLEVLSQQSEERDTGAALRLAQLAHTAGAALYIHPDQDRDIERDQDHSRRELRKLQLQKYPRLPTAPRPTERQTKILGPSTTGSNDWVDQSLLAAVEARAVDFLVTQDGRLQNRATRLGVGERVISLPDALQMLEMLFDRVVAPPPRVDRLVAYELRGSDPIFEGVRDDYAGFDSWLDRIRSDHERPVWCISDFATGNYAGICIGKKQQDGEYGIPGKTMKLCTLAVAQGSSGFRFGELLLGTVFEYATANGYESIWVTVFAKHERLIDLLETFGFRKLDAQTKSGELILVKTHKPATTGVSPLEYNVRFGPRAFMYEGVPTYLVPIQPGFHRRLFPGAEPQIDFFAGSDPCGNAILKAYLCRSPIQSLGEGDVLIFYRSQHKNQSGGATAVGVTEDVMRSTHTDALVDHVARRTVYSYGEIAGLSARGPVLSILFRLALCRPWTKRVTIDRMVSAGVVRRAPQSITRLNTEGAEWLLQHLMT
jgi:L-amino acid N-acyltransferase YncA